MSTKRYGVSEHNVYIFYLKTSKNRKNTAKSNYIRCVQNLTLRTEWPLKNLTSRLSSLLVVHRCSIGDVMETAISPAPGEGKYVHITLHIKVHFVAQKTQRYLSQIHIFFDKIFFYQN